MWTRSFRRILQEKRGQTAVEYLLTTMILVTAFAFMFGFFHQQLTKLFMMAGVRILSAYPK